MKKLKVFFFLTLFLSSFSFQGVVWAKPPIDLKELLAKAQPGQWVRMQNPGKMQTTTVVTRKDANSLTLEMHTLRGKIPQSWVKQVINLKTKQVIECQIKYPDGTIDLVPQGSFESWVQTLDSQKYKKVGHSEEVIKVPAGQFNAQHYRTIYDDRLIHVWISKEVPLLQLVKMRYQGGTSVLVGYGDKGVQAVFK